MPSVLKRIPRMVVGAVSPRQVDPGSRADHDGRAVCGDDQIGAGIGEHPLDAGPLGGADLLLPAALHHRVGGSAHSR